MSDKEFVSSIKATARGALLGNLNVAVTATLLYGLIYVTATRLISAGGSSVLWLQAGSLLVSLFAGVFLSGFAFLNINMIYGNKPALAHLFHGFREEPSKAILIQTVHVVISLFCNLPLFVYSAMAGENFKWIPGGLLALAVPVLSFLMSLPFSQAFYLLQDFPERSVRDLLMASVRLMEGNKRRMFRLALSFLPLFLLCVLTAFLPFLWLMPYYRASTAVFYKQLMGGGDGAV